MIFLICIIESNFVVDKGRSVILVVVLFLKLILVSKFCFLFGLGTTTGGSTYLSGGRFRVTWLLIWFYLCFFHCRTLLLGFLSWAFTNYRLLSRWLTKFIFHLYIHLTIVIAILFWTILTSLTCILIYGNLRILIIILFILVFY